MTSAEWLGFFFSIEGQMGLKHRQAPANPLVKSWHRQAPANPLVKPVAASTVDCLRMTSGLASRFWRRAALWAVCQIPDYLVWPVDHPRVNLRSLGIPLGSGVDGPPLDITGYLLGMHSVPWVNRGLLGTRAEDPRGGFWFGTSHAWIFARPEFHGRIEHRRAPSTEHPFEDAVVGNVQGRAKGWYDDIPMAVRSGNLMLTTSLPGAQHNLWCGRLLCIDQSGEGQPSPETPPGGPTGPVVLWCPMVTHGTN